MVTTKFLITITHKTPIADLADKIAARAYVLDGVENAEAVEIEINKLRELTADEKTNGLAWAVSKWIDEVSFRPLVNMHRRSFDDTWRQVIRYFGGDPVKLCGPAHDDLLIAEKAAS